MFFTKFLVFSLFSLLISVNIIAQNQTISTETESINWLSIEQAEELHKAQPKTIFIDMYTDWCGWCKRLDQTTFSNPAIIRYI
ncbi:MAG: DUF255 domain-containing protein, partial [Bacteroidales bacterium]|nr:DUF255 domain-containing protein [Bacteroidales bacterium]